MSISDDIGNLSRADSTGDEVLSVLEQLPGTFDALRRGVADMHHKVSQVQGEGGNSLTLDSYRTLLMAGLEYLSTSSDASIEAMIQIREGKELGKTYIDRLQS